MRYYQSGGKSWFGMRSVGTGEAITPVAGPLADSSASVRGLTPDLSRRRRRPDVGPHRRAHGRDRTARRHRPAGPRPRPAPAGGGQLRSHHPGGAPQRAPPVIAAERGWALPLALLALVVIAALVAGGFAGAHARAAHRAQPLYAVQAAGAAEAGAAAVMGGWDDHGSRSPGAGRQRAAGDGAASRTHRLRTDGQPAQWRAVPGAGGGHPERRGWRDAGATGGRPVRPVVDSAIPGCRRSGRSRIGHGYGCHPDPESTPRGGWVLAGLGQPPRGVRGQGDKQRS